MFSEAGITATDIGEIDDTNILKVVHDEEESKVFDLSAEGIMHLFV